MSLERDAARRYLERRESELSRFVDKLEHDLDVAKRELDLVRRDLAAFISEETTGREI